MQSRRSFIITASALGAWAASAGAARAANSVTLPFANGTRVLARYPQKRELIVMTSSPVQLETPFSVFNEGVFTPNDAFFVRWHLAGVPTTIDPAAFRISVHGLVDRELSLSLHDLRAFEPVEIAAVCECAGNSRGYSTPRVPGGQWSNGAMGNALWRGARLRDVLERAGVKAGAVQVRFSGLEKPVLPTTPAFVKAFGIRLALSEDVIIAYEMNGAPLPLLNGFPVRLVVPGFYSTYWVKMLNNIEVIDHVDDNFWMKTAYRIPATPGGNVDPAATGFATVPVGTLTIRSFITSVPDGATIPARATTISGIAFNAGSGIKLVEFSSDGGTTWSAATLGRDYGRYSFRPWSVRFEPKAGQSYVLACRATGNDGETQPATPGWNPSGYLRNVIETTKVSVA
jgi:DMSO/TMAO reductase YedYZ molybdopterin-dependent catalytic subunit